MPSSRGIHMRGDRIKTRRGEISRAAPGKPALREAAARPGSSHGNSAHPLLSHSSTRNPSSPSHRGALPPISGLGGQRQYLWLLPAPQDVLSVRKREAGAKGADGPRSVLPARRAGLPEPAERTKLHHTESASVFASARAVSSKSQARNKEGGRRRERERGRERDTALARAAPALLGGASPGCLLWEHSGCRAALPSRPWPSARSSSLAQVQAARAAVAGSSAPAPAQAVLPEARRCRHLL